jgi:hypothetical protein
VAVLAAEVLNDAAVQEDFGWQQPGGRLGWNFDDGLTNEKADAQ